MEYIKAAQELAFLQTNSRYVNFKNKYFHKNGKCLNENDMILASDIKDESILIMLHVLNAVMNKERNKNEKNHWTKNVNYL